MLNYIKNPRDYLLIYRANDLVLFCYTDSNFKVGREERKSTFGYSFLFFLEGLFLEGVLSNLVLLTIHRSKVYTSIGNTQRGGLAL